MKISQITPALIVLTLLVILSCKKHSNPAPAVTNPKSYIANMGGIRVWHGTRMRQCPLCTPAADTTYAAADTFAIAVFDTSEIVVPFTSFTAFDTLYYFSENDTLNTLTFNSGAASSYYNGYLVYYYLKDSIVYETTLSSPADTVTTSLFTP